MLIPHLHIGDFCAPYAVSSYTSACPMTTDRLWAQAFMVPETTTFDTIAAYIHAASSLAPNLARLGIYADNGNSSPGVRILDAGTISTLYPGLIFITISLQLPPGLYWLAIVQGGNASISFGAHSIPLRSAPISYRQPTSSLYASQPWGTLPDPFPSPATIDPLHPFIALFLRPSSIP